MEVSFNNPNDDKKTEIYLSKLLLEFIWQRIAKEQEESD